MIGISLNANAESKFEGKWFTCIPEAAGRKDPYSLMTINKDSNNFEVSSEFSTKYSFTGSGRMVAGNLEVKGCHYYAGEATNKCNPLNPPVTFTLKSKDFQRARPVTKQALLKSLPIYATDKDWRILADQCDRLISPNPYE